jgi:lipopolysaccharide transport system permease protein
MIYYGISWSPNLLMLPVLVAGAVLSALGVGTFLAALNVAYRDFRYVIPFLVQLWMFATPVVYPASLVPREWQWALYLNPMAGVVEGFRSAFLGRGFDVVGMVVSFSIAAVLFAAGTAYFKRVEERFADII